MKVIFDHNIPRKLRRLLKGHYVSIAEEMNWTTLRKVDLLRAAEDAGYEAIVTADQNLSYQQNLSGRRLALVVLSTNNWNIIQQNQGPIIAAVNAAIPGSFQHLDFWPSRGRSENRSFSAVRLATKAAQILA